MQNSLASLRHAYAQMVNGAVKDTAQAKRLAEGLIAPAIERLERASCAKLADAQAEIARLRGALEEALWLAQSTDLVRAEDPLFTHLLNVTKP